MDIGSMSLKQLETLRRSVEKEIEERESTQRKKALDEVRALVKARGLKLEDLLAEIPPRKSRAAKAVQLVKARSKRGPAKIKYRHPAQAGLTWTGRGRQPKWVADWLAGGKALAELAALPDGGM